VDLVMCTDDDESFHDIMSGISDHEMWRFVVKKSQSMWIQYGDLKITKDAVVNLMVEKVGPVAAVELLFEVPQFAESRLSPKAYQRFTKLGRSEICEKKTIIYETLLTVDSYLWSRKPIAICPQIRSVFEMEVSNHFSTTDAKNKPDMPWFLQLRQPGGTLPFEPGEFSFLYEESGGHWGVETDFVGGICPHCTLPLLENPEASGLGMGSGTSVVVFPKCGHAFHNFCNDNDKACSLCLVPNMQSWAKEFRKEQMFN